MPFKNLDEGREYRKRWRLENKERIKKVKRLYAQKNAEKIRFYHYEYNLKNREAIKLSKREYRKKNSAKNVAQQQKN